MKKILLTTLSSIVLYLSFVACSGDDDSTSTPENVIPSSPNNDKLVGKWAYTQMLTLNAKGKTVSTYNAYGKAVSIYDANGKIVYTYPENKEPCPPIAIEFKAGGVSERTIYGLNEDDTCYPILEKGKWNIKGDVFILENIYTEEYGYNSIYTLVTLSNDTLEYEEPISKKMATLFDPSVVKFRHVYKKLNSKN
ncbi:MAG: hypothetical protein LBP34_01335 [Flavobacteriaceae bacterium]|jgi:hypothetical protein|nr:hypothetical protein [Flavobacteriaceae bacterium]